MYESQFTDNYALEATADVRLTRKREIVECPISRIRRRKLK
jgi:hypothetical protein